MTDENTKNEAVPQRPMQWYIGVKIVKASAMQYNEAVDVHGIVVKHEGDREALGYLVEYPDGYRSWCPQEQFEAANRLCDALPFGHAIEAMKKGKRVCRSGWNGKGMWLFIMDRPDEIPEMYGNKHLSYIVMKTAGDENVPWLASQTDMLADDWQIVE